MCYDYGHALYINGDWTSYSTIIPWLISLKSICVIIAPLWEQHEWYGRLLKFTTHCWFIQREANIFRPVSVGHAHGIGEAPWEVAIFFADFRSPNSTPILFSKFPELKDSIKQASRLNEFQQLDQTSFVLDERHTRSPFNVDFLRSVSKGVTNDCLRSEVLDSMENGFRSRYRGNGYFLRDFTNKLNKEKIALANVHMLAEVKKGHCLGPFPTCPFPNAWCDKQAYICQLFFRPKHKFINDGKLRLIGNKSFPSGRSFNDLIDRRDCQFFLPDYKYFTMQSLVEKIRQLGPMCLLSQFDVKDAYKNCKMAPADLWQQVYRVGEEFFIDLGGTFGSRNAGDAWNITMELIVQSMRRFCNAPGLEYYVDNGINITPSISGKPDLEKAKAEFDAILFFLTKAQVPFHDVSAPTTKAKVLGWEIDTHSMTISCPRERFEWIQTIISQHDTKINPKLINSVVGVLTFLATMLPFLKAPLGWLQRRMNKLDNGDEICSPEFIQRFKSFMVYMFKLLHDWKGTASIYDAISTTNPQFQLYSDASGEIGYGFMELSTKSYSYGRWAPKELDDAKRCSAVSSTHLEILAVAKALLTLIPDRASVIVHCDSQAAMFTLERRYCKGSDVVQAVIIGIDRHCRDHGIAMFYQHTPRTNSHIQLVDELSKGRLPMELKRWKFVNCRKLVTISF